MQYYLTAKEIIAMLRISIATLDRWIAKEKFPPPDLKVGKQRLWMDSYVRQWIEINSYKPAKV